MNNTELLELLRTQQQAINDAINELRFYRHAGEDLTAAAKSRRINSIRDLSSSGGVDARAWTGAEV